MILLTGGCGYIGSHIVKHLQQNNIPVVVVDNLATGHRESVTGCPVFIGDIGDAEFIKSIFAQHPVSTVIHLAGFSLVSESQTNPDKYWRNNVDNGRVLLETMVAHNCKQIVFSSTAAVYGEPESVPITEEHQTKPINTYGETKLKFEQLLHRLEREHGLRYISLRYFNAAGADLSGEIGEDHHPESHLVPLVLQVALGKRDQINIYGDNYPTPDGTCVRDYIHVLDLAEAHLLACRALAANKSSNIFNLGNGRGYSVQEVIEAARKVTGDPIPAIACERRAGDPAMLVASSDKIKQELGWSPQYTALEAIIASAWKWHKHNPNGFKGRR